MPDTILREREIFMLREEMEILMSERQRLLDTTGTAAVFAANPDNVLLPDSVHQAMKMLSGTLNDLPEEALPDAREKAKAEFVVRA